jgi:tetratricopeptide (TPR) repeat protein
MNQWDASERCFKRLLEQEHPNPVIVPGCYLHLGNIAHSREHYDEAIEHHRPSLALKQKTLSPDHPHLPYSYNSLGEALRELGDYEDALIQYKSALALWREEYGEDNHENIAMCLHNIGTVHGHRDELQEALRYFLDALRVMARCLPTIHPMVARTLRNVGSVLGLVGQSEQALEKFQRALTIQRQCLPSTHPQLAETLRDIGICYFNSGNISQALSYYQQAAAVLHQTLPMTHPMCIQIQEDMNEVANFQPH